MRRKRRQSHFLERRRRNGGNILDPLGQPGWVEPGRARERGVRRVVRDLVREQIARERQKLRAAELVRADRREDPRVERQIAIFSFLRWEAVNGVPLSFGSAVVNRPTMSEKFSA